MGTVFKCPSCRRRLNFEIGDNAFQECPSCRSKIIVPSSTVHEAEAVTQKPTSYSLQQQRDFKIAEIKSELSAGRKPSAIQIYRDAFGAELSTAKEAVELLQQGKHIPEEAIKRVSLEDRRVEEKIYATPPAVQNADTRSATRVFWLLITIGAALAIAYFVDN